MCMELIRPLLHVLRMLGGVMPLRSGPHRECTSEAPGGVAIGPFRNTNNGQQVVYHALYIDGLVGTHGPQAPAIVRRNVSHTDAISENGRTPTGPGPIDSLQIIAHPPPLPPFALLRYVRRAANTEIQSVEEIKSVGDAWAQEAHRRVIQNDRIRLCTHRARDRRPCRRPRAALLAGAFR